MPKKYAAVLMCATALTAGIAGAAVATPEGTQTDKVTLCHSTGSAKNPFVKITVAAPAAYAHTRHHDTRDVVPPFVHRGVTYSQNWDATGQAIHAAGCAAQTTGGGGGGGNGEFGRKKKPRPGKASKAPAGKPAAPPAPAPVR